VNHCPNCHVRGEDCEPCELFLCADCGRWVPWNFGAADAHFDLCDDCWAVRDPRPQPVKRGKALPQLSDESIEDIWRKPPFWAKV
jgi:hypothetical protein